MLRDLYHPNYIKFKGGLLSVPGLEPLLPCSLSRIVSLGKIQEKHIIQFPVQLKIFLFFNYAHSDFFLSFFLCTCEMNSFNSSNLNYFG